jgi:hypothetical protein
MGAGIRSRFILRAHNVISEALMAEMSGVDE